MVKAETGGRTRGSRIALLIGTTKPRGSIAHAIAFAEVLHARGTAVVVYAVDETGDGFYRTPRCPHVVIPAPAHGERHTAADDAYRRIDACVRTLTQRSDAFDVFHAHDDVSGSALATLAERSRIARYVRTVQHVAQHADAALADLQSRSMRGAAQTFTTSGLWRNVLKHRMDVESTIVPNGVDRSRFTAVRGERRTKLRRALGFGARPLFLTIGGIEARKNSIGTLEAFARVRATHPSATLVVAGDAALPDLWYSAAFDERAKTLGLGIGREVCILGCVSEASACETPVVTSRIAPFTEYLARDEALLVDPHDPVDIAEGMCNALEPAVAMMLAEHGRAVARERSWEACADAYLAHYVPRRAECRDVLRA